MYDGSDETAGHENEYDTILFEDGKVLVDGADDRRVTSEETTASFPEYWQAKNDTQLYAIFTDLKSQSAYSSLFDALEYGDFCEYMDYVNNNDTVDTCAWTYESVRENAMRSPPKLHPSFKRWARHFLCELFDLYVYMWQCYAFDFGGFEIFMDFAYDSSSRCIKI